MNSNEQPDDEMADRNLGAHIPAKKDFPDSSRDYMEQSFVDCWNACREAAITAWNRRTPPPSGDGLPELPPCWTGSPVTVTWREDGEKSTREVYTRDDMIRTSGPSHAPIRAVV